MIRALNNVQVTYHGVTGWDQGEDLPISSPLVHVHDTTAVPLPSLADTVSQNEALAPIFQALATSKHISVAPELGDALLNSYHCWEILEITDRASFLRDMVLGGPCYSELLLMILYASASRMIDGLTEEQKLAQGDLFVKLAKAYLYKEMEGPTKITTIQSLLLLSSRECALDDISQGWNHAGLAFRMIQDVSLAISNDANEPARDTSRPGVRRRGLEFVPGGASDKRSAFLGGLHMGQVRFETARQVADCSEPYLLHLAANRPYHLVLEAINISSTTSPPLVTTKSRGRHTSCIP